MSEATGTALILGTVLAAGVALGAGHFLTLHWLCRQVASGRWRPVLLIVGAVVRLGLFVVVFAWLLAGDWQRGIACLLGVLAGRQAVVTWSGRRDAAQSR